MRGSGKAVEVDCGVSIGLVHSSQALGCSVWIPQMVCIRAVFVDDIQIQVFQCVCMLLAQRVADGAVEWRGAAAGAEAYKFVAPLEGLKRFGGADCVDGIFGGEIRFIEYQCCNVRCTVVGFPINGQPASMIVGVWSEGVQ